MAFSEGAGTFMGGSGGIYAPETERAISRP